MPFGWFKFQIEFYLVAATIVYKRLNSAFISSRLSQIPCQLHPLVESARKKFADINIYFWFTSKEILYKRNLFQNVTIIRILVIITQL